MKPKTDKKKKNTFDTVKTFRAIKEKISVDIADMDAEQIKEYFKQRRCGPTSDLSQKDLIPTT